MTVDPRHGRRQRNHPRATRFLRVVVCALGVGAGFGALTSLVNAISHSYSDLESREATTSGVSAIEVMSLLVDSGWAWAGLAVAIGWLVTRAGNGRSADLVQAAVAGALALLAATAAYAVADTARDGGPLSSWYQSEQLLWWIASVVLGPPLGAVGACVKRPGVIGLLARLTVPVGAAVQMIVLPPGRNEVLATTGQVVVWAGAAATIAAIVIGFLRAERRRPSPAVAQSP